MFTGVRKRQTKNQLNIDWKHFLQKCTCTCCSDGVTEFD